MKDIKVLVLMGSKSDAEVVGKAEAVLREFEVPYATLVRSAHRTPEATIEAVREAEAAGCEVFICAAGMAAHLAGVVCSKTVRPVIGLPIAAGPLKGQDALYSTVMMPPGLPVATVGINAAKNAALLAIQILATHDSRLRERLIEDRRAQAAAILGGH